MTQRLGLQVLWEEDLLVSAFGQELKVMAGGLRGALRVGSQRDESTVKGSVH